MGMGWTEWDVEISGGQAQQESTQLPTYTVEGGLDLGDVGQGGQSFRLALGVALLHHCGICVQTSG